MIKAFVLFLILHISCFCPVLKAQTFFGTTGPIVDISTVTYTCNVTGLTPGIIDSTFGLESICLSATHTYDSDLDFTLIAPDGTEILLISALGGGDDNFYGTCLNSNAAQSILTQSAPFSGTFKPMTNLSLANNGQNGNGTWQLRITDNYSQDDGDLLGWNLVFGNNPAPIFTFSSSNLPILKINTNGQTIVDEPKIPVDFMIIDNGYGNINHVNDAPNHYNGRAAIEIRGSSSQMFPKKSYGLETADVNDVEMDTAIMGMPSESDWVLNANYSDKSLMRNTLAYNIFGKMGHYSVRYRYCELLINDVYQGVYIFMEKIKRDADRVDISKLDSTDNAWPDVSGGYIVKIDKTTGGSQGWQSNYAPAVSSNQQVIEYLFDYPDESEITPSQVSYISAYIDSFETAVFAPYFADTNIGYRRYIDMDSFIDMFILNELSKNVDGYRISSYLYKKKITKGGKLYAGPAWDYDIAFRNANYCQGSTFTGWAYQFGNVCPTDGKQVPAWWARFLSDPNFTTRLKCRWLTFRQQFIRNDSIQVFTDSLVQLLASAQARNFENWPILGMYVWPNPTPYDTSHAAEVIRLKTWLSNRINWLDQNMPGSCLPVSVATTEYTKPVLFPNPAQHQLNVIKPSSGMWQLRVYNATGEMMMIPVSNHSDRLILDVSALPAGIYQLVMDLNGTVLSSQFVCE